VYVGLQLDKIIAAISKKKFKRQLHLEAEKVTPSTSLIISNKIEKKRDEEFLWLYFSNPKFSGVGEFDDIEILDDGRVIVHLCNQESKFLPYLYSLLSFIPISLNRV